MAEFRMPSLGADMEAGILVEWLKKPGDMIHRGDIIAVVETDKGAIEVEIFMDGVMGNYLVGPDTKVPVGTPLAVIEGAQESVPPASMPEAAEAMLAPAPEATRPLRRELSAGGLRASPAARQLAAAHHVVLETISGTGPGGAIVLADVEKARSGRAAPATPQKPPAKRLDMDKMRRAIAAAMAKSKREIPHYYLSTEIDMERVSTWLGSTNAKRDPDARLLAAVLTLKAVALAVRKHPNFNGFYNEPAGFTASDSVHIGTAIAIRGGGLISPAIHNCDQLDVDELMARLRDLVVRAREGHLRSSELTDATITVSSLGERGVENIYGIIYPPQVAIIGLGKMMPRAVAVEDKIEIRPIIAASLAADHRATDGHLGSRFLNEIASLLQEPEKL